MMRYGTGSFDAILNNLTFQNSASEAAVQFSSLTGEIEIRDVRFQQNLAGALSINTANDNLNVVVDNSEFLSNVRRLVCGNFCAGWMGFRRDK